MKERIAQPTSKKKRLPLFLLVILPTIAAATWLIADRIQSEHTAANDPDPIAWETGLASAIEKANSEDQRVLVRVSADWCPPCNLMDIKVWPDDEVKAVLRENYIPVELDVDVPENGPILESFGIRGIPTLIVLDANGQELKRAHYLNRSQTIDFLETSES
ncbi:thioredoxin family protein [Puniceicoccus vermicola]|uniref:Thioredoxin family protein n=1 Tax=Puniceicoccus vermicola TaxID=388746 RepID=A0A7X1AYJ8_9BACT|nr:thioredoxin family protein [Puniceicoccus vermicola]MBC2602356.1 thioredoxin family protein [Puniceicoccus vermicola]